MVFYKLPTDIQICIAETWVAGSERQMLRLLSILILASNRGTAQELLGLTKHPSQHWSAQSDDSLVANWWAAKNLFWFIPWLHRWQVPLKTLRLSQRSLRSIDGIIPNRYMHIMPSVTKACIPGCLWESTAVLLGSCPNLTAVSLIGRGIMYDCSELRLLLQNLPDLRLASLKLGLWRSSDDLPLLLAQHGKHLQVLHMTLLYRGEDLLSLIGQYCKGIRELKVRYILHFLISAHVSEVEGLLAACPCLTNLTLDASSVVTTQYVVRFGEIISQHPWVECLDLSVCRYERSKRALFLAFTEAPQVLTAEVIASILTHCKPLYKLCLFVSLSMGSLLRALEEHMGDVIMDLELRCHSHTPCAMELLQLAMRCPLLRRLKLTHGFTETLSDGMLKALATACPLLLHLELEGREMPHVSDEGILAVLRGCRDLKVLRIGPAYRPSYRILNFILFVRLPLELLSCRFDSIPKEQVTSNVYSREPPSFDVQKFYKLVKEQQMLPMLKIRHF